jgi:hypothetical protein
VLCLSDHLQEESCIVIVVMPLTATGRLSIVNGGQYEQDHAGL